MPKPDDSTDSNDISDASRIQSVVETALEGDTEDEKDKKSTEGEESQDDNVEEEEAGKKADDSKEDESEEENSDDDDETEEEDKPDDKATAERKFKNLAADTDAGYITNLEKAYENSSAEAIRLNSELATTNRRVDAIISAAQKDPELAKQLNKVLDNIAGGTSSGTDDTKNNDNDTPKPTDNPFLVNAEREWQEKSRTEVQEILDANPELASDPEKNKNVRHWMEVFSAEEYRVNKKLMSGGEAMEKAMKHLGYEDKRETQSTATKAKEAAAPARPTKGRGAPKPKASKATPEAYEFASKLGVSKETVDKYAQ